MHTWVMVFDICHLDKAAKPGEWFGNVFEGNTFFHAKAGEKEMVLYNHRGNAVTWSVPELERRYPGSWKGDLEGKARRRLAASRRASPQLRVLRLTISTSALRAGPT